MHPWEEAELLIWQLDTGTALCRVFCRIVIWLLHTLIHPQPWEQSYSYTICILLLISCTYGYKTRALLRDYLHLPLHVVCCTINIFFQTVCTNISKIKEKPHVKWQYLQINYTLRDLKYYKRYKWFQIITAPILRPTLEIFLSSHQSYKENLVFPSACP